jgi:Ca2+-binding RTX toxin-like protein
VNIDSVLTGAGDDIIRGNDSDNSLISGSGDDVVRGGGGNDTSDPKL